MRYQTLAERQHWLKREREVLEELGYQVETLLTVDPEKRRNIILRRPVLPPSPGMRRRGSR